MRRTARAAIREFLSFWPVPTGGWVAAGIFLAGAAFFMALPSLSGQTNFAWGHMPLDDAWIHLSYAKNLLAHGYLTYNPGAVETGSTSPLWALVLAAALAVLRHPVVAAKALGLVLGAACIAALHGELRKTSGRVAAWTGSLMLALDPMWAMSCTSGMEVPLAALLLVVFAGRLRRGQVKAAGVLAGLLVLARPEMAACAAAGALILFFILWRGSLPGDRFKKTGLSLLHYAGLALAVALPWFLYCRLGTGRWLPSSFYVKAGSVHWGLEKGLVFYGVLEHGFWPSPLVHDPVCLALLAAGAAVALGLGLRRPALLAWPALPLAHALAWTLLSTHTDTKWHAGQYLTFYFDRYYVPAYPVLFGLAGLGAAALAAGLARLGAALQTGLSPAADRLTRRALAAAVPLMLASGNLFGWWTHLGPLWLLGDSLREEWYARALYNNEACRAITQLHEAAGRWIAAHIPPDAPLATQDAGAIRYFTRNPLVDLCGLNSHAWLTVAESEKAAFLRARGIRYAVLFPATPLAPLFNLKMRTIQQFAAPGNVIAESDLLEVREILPER